MENNIDNGTDWNIHENLKEFKSGKQDIHKTRVNIRLLFGESLLQEKEYKELIFLANQERERLSLLPDN